MPGNLHPQFLAMVDNGLVQAAQAIAMAVIVVAVVAATIIERRKNDRQSPGHH